MSEIELIVRGIVRRGDEVLLVRMPGRSWFFLPGGHVDFGEPAEVALAREMVEELGTTGTVGVFRGAVENLWEDHHEVNLVFELTLDAAEPASIEEHLEFLWCVPAQVEIRPAALAGLLAVPPGSAMWSGATAL